MSKEKSDHLIVALNPGNAGGAKGGDKLRRSGSGQLTFVFTDSPELNTKPEAVTSQFGSEVDRYASELAGREYLLFRAKFKEAGEPDAGAEDADPLLDSIARTPNLADALLKVASHHHRNRFLTESDRGNYDLKLSGQASRFAG